MTNFALLFDLDGVLIDSRETHFDALNLALKEFGEQYVITTDEQESTYEGLTTKDKLNLLHLNKGLPLDVLDQVWKKKQEHTAELFMKVKTDEELIEIFKLIKSRNFCIAVVSNSTRATLDACLTGLGISDYVNISLSNEDVLYPKPNPDGYREAIKKLEAKTFTSAIFEDSLIGRTAATKSGATMIPVDSRSDLTKELIKEVMDKLEEVKEGPVFNILVPMAGAGNRFAEKGYTKPKFYIDVDGVPMIQPVVYSLNMNGNYIYLAQAEHNKEYELATFLRNLCPYAPTVTVVDVNGLTEGAASTSLLAKDLIDTEAPLVICNSDQIVHWNSGEFLGYAGDKNLDGCIAVFESDEPRWSYAKLDEDGFVSEVAEKQVISNLATVGIYYWKHGSDYVKYAEQMIANGIRTNGEFYICPTYNEAIADGKKIGVYQVDKMISLGTPSDLEEYLGS